MALKMKHGNAETHEEVEFAVGDVVRVHQRIIEEGKKERIQVFEGTVIAAKNRGTGKSFVVRRIGTQKVGIEMIFPLSSPLIERVEVKRKGERGVRRSKLYYLRNKSKRETEKVFSRSVRRVKAKEEKKVEKVTKRVQKKASKK